MNDYVKQLLDLVRPDTKSGLQFLTGAWMLVLTLLFLYAFAFPTSWVGAAVHQLQLPQWVYGMILVLAVQAVVVLLGGDALVHGDPNTNAFVAAFRRSLPSSHLALTLHISEDAARAEWFAKLNEWMSPDSSGHARWERAIRLGYACRFVYHLQTMALWLLWASCSWLFLEWVIGGQFGHSVTSLEAKLLAIGVFGSLWVLIRSSNRIRMDRMSGVWRREYVMNRQLCDWIDLHPDEFGPEAADEE